MTDSDDELELEGSYEDDDLEEDLDEDLDGDVEPGEELDDAFLEDEDEQPQAEDTDDLPLSAVDEEVDDDPVLAAITGEDDVELPDPTDDEDVDDGLRDGEFICRSCFMAKRESALADPKRMLCRDCA